MKSAQKQSKQAAAEGKSRGIHERRPLTTAKREQKTAAEATASSSSTPALRRPTSRSARCSSCRRSFSPRHPHPLAPAFLPPADAREPQLPDRSPRDAEPLIAFLAPLSSQSPDRAHAPSRAPHLPPIRAARSAPPARDSARRPRGGEAAEESNQIRGFRGTT